MRGVRPRVLAVALLVVLATWGVVPGGGAGTDDATVAAGGAAAVDAAVASPDNDADRDAGAVVADGVSTQGDALGEPVGPADGGSDAAVYRQVSSFAAAYDEEQPALGFGGRFARGNVVNFHVVGPDGATVVSFRLTEANRIEDLRAGARTDARLRVETDRATFDRVVAADRPGDAFARALDSGAVRISGRGPASGTVWAVLNVLRDLQGGA